MKLQDIKLTPLLDTLYLEDISDEEYFSKKFSNYISNSRLSLINPEQEGTPDKFFNSKFNNFSESLVLGSLVHCMALQPESYTICNSADRPSGKAGQIADLTYKKTGEVPTDEEWKAYLAYEKALNEQIDNGEFNFEYAVINRDTGEVLMVDTLNDCKDAVKYYETTKDWDGEMIIMPTGKEVTQ